MNVVLIGYRGSGKTSIGRRLAELLGLGFVDTDILIADAAGTTIRDIFAAEGEAGFRQRESAAIASVATRDGLVIALGGGAVLNPGNLQALKASGRAHVIWLRAPAEVLHARIQGDAATSATRPNLTAAGGLEEVRRLLAQRKPLYEAAADHEIDVSDLSIEKAARDAAERLRP
jgi:shikimate kinase